MNDTGIIYTPIGTIHSEHTDVEATPIQPLFAKECLGRVVILPEYSQGLSDLEGFSHIYLLYHFHLADGYQLYVRPFLEGSLRGVFATRASCRPNQIGLSVVELLTREGNTLYVKGVDILDGTPLLDIKPYTAKFDCITGTRNGWQDRIDESAASQRGRRGFTG